MQKNKKTLKIIMVVVLLLTAVVAIFGKKYYDNIYSSNITVNSNDTYLFIPTGANFEDLLNILEKLACMKDIESFKQVANLKKFTKVKAGKYKLTNGMSNNELVNLLRIGEQEPVKLSFISVRDLKTLAGKVAVYIEPDSSEIASVLLDPEVSKKYGFNKQTFPAMFIPNTYEFYWNTTAEEFVEKMAKEFKAFWNNERKQKAAKLGYSQSQISTIASIVEKETQKNDEKQRISGVYINRLKRGMLLQADPTVVFAVGDFELKRVLNKHLKHDSPYNTYLYAGLPPGPICIPATVTIDAVLNYEKHSYLYFCAKEDFSGYHSFAKNLSQHNENARRYHRALQKANIR